MPEGPHSEGPPSGSADPPWCKVPCQPLDGEEETEAPGDAVAVAADPVPENTENDAPVARASLSINLRKKFILLKETTKEKKEFCLCEAFSGTYTLSNGEWHELIRSPGMVRSWLEIAFE